jgi:hypothetical protein
MNSRPVCIAGTGCVCAAGGSVEEVVLSLYSGKRNPGPPVGFVSDLPEYPPVFEIFADLTRFAVHENHTRTTLLALAAIHEG